MSPLAPPSLAEPLYGATVPAMLHEMSKRWPAREAIVSPNRRLTFSSLELESAELARGLLAQGVGKGTRVGLLMGNSPDWVCTFFAITRIGAVAVPLSTLYQAPELGWAIRHADISHLIMAAAYLRHDYVERLEQAFSDLSSQKSPDLWMAGAPYLRRVYVMGETDRAWASRWPDRVLTPHSVTPAILAETERMVSTADLMFILYTSGSTAEPKAVVHLQGPVVRYSYGMGVDYVLPGEGDRIATTRPFFWVAGLVPTLFCCLQKGVTIVCLKSGSGRDVLEAIESEGLTAIVGREAWLAEVGASPEIAASDFTPVRLGYDYSAIAAQRRSDAAPSFRNPRLEARHPARMGPPPPTRLPRYYGMTETLGTWVSEPAFAVAPEGIEWTCGHPVPGTEHRLVEPRTGRDLPVGEVGELLVRGAPLMDGLYKRERHDTFEADGFYRTGDLCEFDQQGFLFVRGRLGEMIKVKGANVAPAEVERWLTQYPGISEAVVVGLPTSDGRDNDLCAAVVPAPAVKVRADDVIAILKTKVSAFKVPKTIFVLTAEEIPRTGSGKVARGQLTAQLSERLRSDAVTDEPVVGDR